jgi:uncharacterized membrane protein YidH (DUF202 family)
MQQDLNLFETGLDETAKAHLLETTRWTKFIGICAVVILAITVLYMIITFMTLNKAMGNNSEYEGIVGMVMTIATLIMIGLYCYPIYALLKFSSCMKKGIQSNSQELINDGFRYQKNMFRYTGILLIISLVCILLSVIVGGVGLMAGM